MVELGHECRASLKLVGVTKVEIPCSVLRTDLGPGFQVSDPGATESGQVAKRPGLRGMLRISILAAGK